MASSIVACRGGGEDARAGAATLLLRVTDGPGGPLLPARVLFLDGDEALHFGTKDLFEGKRQAKGYCILADGALGTWDGVALWRGEAELPVGGGDGCEPSPGLPLGHYKVQAWRGPEHERWEGEVELVAGKRVELTIPLERAFRVDGAVSADFHVHAAGSGDSGIPNPVRVMTLLSAGVTAVALSDHNSNGDLDQAIAELGVVGQIASLPSNELGSSNAHFGVYPVQIDGSRARGGSPSEDETRGWSTPQLIAWARNHPGALIQVNHPRFRVYSLFDSTGWDGKRWPPPFPLDFDALEVLAGHTIFNVAGDRRTDDGVRDFYTLTTHGKLVTPLGNSDTHHLNGVRDGLTRSYLFGVAPDASDEEVLAAVRQRRSVATSCPLLDVEAMGQGASVGPGQAVRVNQGKIELDLEVRWARWCPVSELRVWLGQGGREPTNLATISLAGDSDRDEAPEPQVFRTKLTVAVTGGEDGWLGVDASGDDPLPIEMTGTYHLEKGRPGAVPYAIISPILIDGDGDGRVKFGAADLAVP